MKALQPVWKKFEKDIGAEPDRGRAGGQRRKLIRALPANPRPGRSGRGQSDPVTGGMPEPSDSRIGQVFDRLEETLIAVFLGLMTVITLANVVARYVFNDNILWALEATVFLFAWLVLLGASYAVKHSLHLGIDLLVNALGPAARRSLGLVSVAALPRPSRCCC